MTRTRGRAPRGVRVEDNVPGGHWKMLTVVGAMDHNGMLATIHDVALSRHGWVIRAKREPLLIVPSPADKLLKKDAPAPKKNSRISSPIVVFNPEERGVLAP
ncbi:MAG: hypothetical protein JST61_16125 [Acidobacteria bacterium]|nr:hypothetical protein [Acidobacteriota bacterium]